MITWMTTKSIFDSLAALKTDELVVQMDDAESLFYELTYGEPTSDVAGEIRPAPAPLKMMWYGYEAALGAYVAAAGATLVGRGISSGIRSASVADVVAELRREDPMPLVMPPWFEDLDFLRSHRSNMMRRWPRAYSWNGTPPLMPYLWPVVDEDGGYVLKLSKHDKALVAAGDRKLPKSIAERIES